MNKLFVSTFCLFFVLFSCKRTQNANGDHSETESQEITEKDISNIDYIEFLLDEKTEVHVSDWIEYNQLQEVIDNVKNADLSFFYDNKGVIDTTLIELKKNIPEPVNSPSITARISAFETKFLKLESLSNLSTTSKQELLNSVEDLLVAFSNLNLQMNKKVEFDNQDIQKP
ncbi:hypothetical protein [Seonamhaeicola sp.]|uniref:hypothetical protein n=1 Tax=Seonamhaeicola sp. TaxID=1912245 RepID=UPI0026311A08|nr:hypothetical protein [Seonamhaeicola sp.]